jgi:acyl-CoA hydrolase
VAPAAPAAFRTSRVVTEYGVAELRGRSLRERTHRLIAVAPKFRDALLHTARELCYLTD